MLILYKQCLEILELVVGSEKWGETGLEVADWQSRGKILTRPLNINQEWKEW